MAYCPKCGNQVSGAANFCKACGYELEAEETQIEQEEGGSKEVTPEQVKPVSTSPQRSEEVNARGADEPAKETSSWQSLQKAYLQKLAAIYIVCGIVTSIVSGVLTAFLSDRGVYAVVIFIVMGIAAIFLWINGCICYAESKGRSGTWGLFGLLGLLGILIIVCLDDKPIKSINIIEHPKPRDEVQPPGIIDEVASRIMASTIKCKECNESNLIDPTISQEWECWNCGNKL